MKEELKQAFSNLPISEKRTNYYSRIDKASRRTIKNTFSLKCKKL